MGGVGGVGARSRSRANPNPNPNPNPLEKRFCTAEGALLVCPALRMERGGCLP